MWNPGFPYEEVRTARIYGYHRALCVSSWHFRGSQEKPGLVLGLDRGGSCKGRIFSVSKANQKTAFDYFFEREMVTDFYKPKWLTAYAGEEAVPAYAFVADPHHEQYAGDLSEQEVIKRLLNATGKGGRCLDYLRNLISHLDDLNISDSPLHELLRKAETLASNH